jgi:Zn-dependent M16 (insulinase) family peptidase
MAERENRRVAAELADKLAGMNETDLAVNPGRSAALEKLQETQENVDCLPTLQRDDIPPAVVCIDPSPGPYQPPVWTYDQAHIGDFLYFRGVWAPARSRTDLLPLVPFFCHTVSKVGTKDCDYTQMARRMDLYTGGVGFSANARTRFDDSGDCLPSSPLPANAWSGTRTGCSTSFTN